MSKDIEYDELEQKVFKTTFLGFKRSEVLEHIESLSKENSERQQKLRDSIEELQSEMSKSRSDNDVLIKKTREICEKLTEEKQIASDRLIKIETLEKELETVKSQLGVETKKVAFLTKEKEELSSYVTKVSQELSKERSRSENIKTACDLAIAKLNSENEAFRLKAKEELELAQKEADEQKKICEKACELVKAESEKRKQEQLYHDEEKEKLARLAKEKEFAQKQELREMARVKALEEEKAEKEINRLANSMDIINDNIEYLRGEISDIERRIEQASNSINITSQNMKNFGSDNTINKNATGVQYKKPEYIKFETQNSKVSQKPQTLSETLMATLSKILDK